MEINFSLIWWIETKAQDTKFEIQWNIISIVLQKSREQQVHLKISITRESFQSKIQNDNGSGYSEEIKALLLKQISWIE